MNLTLDQLKLAANTVRMLSADAVEKANSGHPGMPMGAADYGVVLWLKYLNFQPQDPHWLNRDRFVLSNGHGSMFLYSMLHLSGYALPLDELKNFRQWGSITPGHPESFMTPGVEATTGPLGQGVSNAVGMAIGQKHLAARYGLKDLLNHQVYAFVGDGCLMEGVSSEASSLAGHLGLGNLTVIYDDNHISIAGNTSLAFSEDVLKRYEAYGWRTMRIDGHNYDEIDRALAEASRETERPTLIAARTKIGFGAPHKADTREAHGEPLGKDELAATKKNLGWPLEPTFYVPEETRALFAQRVEELRVGYQQWQEQFAKWKAADSARAVQFDRQISRDVPKDLQEKLLAALPKPAAASSTRKLQGAVLQVLSKEVPSVIGGSADLEPSTLTLIKDSTDVATGEFAGLNLRYGVREHGMGAVMNGLSYYGGYIPYGSTFLCFSDYMRPTLRLAALSHLTGLFIYTHDSIFLGEDGPTHQPIEHVNSLRMIPNLWVMRPADGNETAICYAMAVERKDGPSALIFTRQNLDPIEAPAGFKPDDIRRGAYTAYQSSTATPELVFIASGSEVPLAIAAAKKLTQQKNVRVVSMPCWNVFAKQPADIHESIIPAKAVMVTVEAGTTYGWTQMVGGDPRRTLNIGIDHFGASAPAPILAEKFGFTPDSIVQRVQEFISGVK